MADRECETEARLSFEALSGAWDWKPIRNCPGRFVLAGPNQRSIRDLLGQTAKVKEFDVTAARDRVLVAVFDGGGLISYQREDGTLLHTLNTTDGLRRKLDQLGISQVDLATGTLGDGAANTSKRPF